MFNDYNEFVQRVLRDEIQDTVFRASMEPLERWFPREDTLGGDRITDKMEVARSSPAGSYDKSDVDPAPATSTKVKPYWEKVYYHTACEIHNIDLNQARNGGTDIDLVRTEITQEAKELMAKVWDGCMTQLKNDVSASAIAYSDKSLSRSTYPTLASYEEDTDATITVAYMRGMINNTTINKTSGPKSGYIILLEESVYNTFNPLAAAIHAWQINDPVRNQQVDMGYQPTASFDGVQVEAPDGMTTGDCFMLRRQDIIRTPHRGLEIVQVPSGRDSVKFVLRIGYNIRAKHPGFQGIMTDKD